MGCAKEETKKDTLECQTHEQLSTQKLSTQKDIKKTKPYQKNEKKNRTSKHAKTEQYKTTKKVTD